MKVAKASGLCGKVRGYLDVTPASLISFETLVIIVSYDFHLDS